MGIGPEVFSTSRRKKEFRNDGHEWGKTVRFFINGNDASFLSQDHDTNICEYRELRDLDYLIGPICANAREVRIAGNSRSVELKPYIKSNPWQRQLFYQLCLRNQSIANDFCNKGKNIHQVIFFVDRSTNDQNQVARPGTTISGSRQGRPAFQNI